MDYIKSNIFILLFNLYVLAFIQASSPGFDIKVAKFWVTNSVTFAQFDGVIDNASNLKIKNWYIEIPYDKSVNDLHGTWGCEIEVKDDKIVITSGDINSVVKAKTNAVFGFIVSNPDSNYDVEKAILYFNDKEIPNHTEADDSEDDKADINGDLPFEDNRYYPESMDIKELKAAASALSVSEVKKIIFKELVEHWDLIKK